MDQWTISTSIYSIVLIFIAWMFFEIRKCLKEIEAALTAIQISHFEIRNSLDKMRRHRFYRGTQ